MSHSLAIKPLTKASFAPYGEVIEREGAERRLINEGTTDRLHALARAEVGDGQAIVSIFEARRRVFPVAIAMMERHPLGSQAFIPLETHEWLVVVSDAAGPPTPESLRCFCARGDQGVNYRTNVWHHPLLILLPTQDFLIVDRDGAGQNLEEFWFPEPAATIGITPAGG